jgi:hypothetical protein
MKILTLLLMATLLSCSAPKVTQVYTTTDYGSDQAYAQKWMGGAPGSGSGVTLYFPAALFSDVDISKVYFRGLETDTVNYTDENKRIMMVRFTYKNTNSPNRSLSSKDEYGNEAPDLKPFPYELQPTEAMIEVLKNNRTKLVKLTNIKEQEMQVYPSMPRR